MPHHPLTTGDGFTRRQLLKHSGMGFGSLALGALFTNSAQAETTLHGPLSPHPPQFAPKAKRVIHLFMNGGPSQVDTFDPKPMLAKYAGKAIPLHMQTERRTGAGFPSPFKFIPQGQSGIPVSEIFPEVGKCIDDICVIRSMMSEIPNHEPSLMMMNCGDVRAGAAKFRLVGYIWPGIRESEPSWLHRAMPERHADGRRKELAVCFSSRRISRHANRYRADRSRQAHREHPQPNASLDEQRRQLSLLEKLNARYAQAREEDAVMEASVESFELAYRMQMEAADVFDLKKEPANIREMYGDTLQGRQMLIARRLLEKGVRFVQVWHGAGQPWDSHTEIAKEHRKLAAECDQPIAALLKDLKQRGMLEDTLVIWGGEFGRTPTVELAEAGANNGTVSGRDHNPYGFSMWVAGGGFKAGHVYGATDEFGFAAEENKVHVHDLHATLLHQLGFDHTKLTYRYAGRDFRLTDVAGNIVTDLLA